MDNLLCDESWLSDPLSPESLPNFRLNIHEDHVAMSPGVDAATVEEAMSIDLEKETCFSNHGAKFIEFLATKKLIDDRLQTVQWLIQVYSYLFCYSLGFLSVSGKKWFASFENLYVIFGTKPLNIIDA